VYFYFTIINVVLRFAGDAFRVIVFIYVAVGFVRLISALVYRRRHRGRRYG